MKITPYIFNFCEQMRQLVEREMLKIHGNHYGWSAYHWMDSNKHLIGIRSSMVGQLSYAAWWSVEQQGTVIIQLRRTPRQCVVIDRALACSRRDDDSD